MTLYEILLKSAEVGLKLQRKDGSFPPGHNGPYHDQETPVRNTAHWSITLIKAFKISNDSRFRDAALKCKTYLLSKEARPMNATFWSRTNPEKDFSNGLIGQAWVIESLIELSKLSEEKLPLRIALEVFNLHPFDIKFSAWRRVNVDGSYNTFDPTLNHQIWFAATGALLSRHIKEEDLEERVILFLDHLPYHISIYRDGCIKHMPPSFLNTSFIKTLIGYVKDLKKPRRLKIYMRMKSVGYHGFNLYGLALLKMNFPEHRFWKSYKMKKIIDFANSKMYKKEIRSSKYGFPYNPPGFEVSLGFQEFNVLAEEEISEWIKYQLELCYDFSTNTMIKGNTEDLNTSTARLYEATRLNDYKLNLDFLNQT